MRTNDSPRSISQVSDRSYTATLGSGCIFPSTLGILSFECIYILSSGKNLLAFSTVWEPQEPRRKAGVTEGPAVGWAVVWTLGPS